MLHFSTSKAELHRIISLIQNIVSKKGTMPIMANFLLSASKNELRIFASDLDVTALATLPCEVLAEGSTCVKGSMFGEVVRELPEGAVEVQVTSNQRVEVTAGAARLKLNGVSASEFPTLHGIGLPLRGRIVAQQLSEMISKTIYAVSHDEARFHLNGLCFEVVPGGIDGVGAELRAVALDGHRLATVSRRCSPPSVSEQVIVPRKGLTELRRVLDEDPASEVEFDMVEGFFAVRTRQIELAMRLIDGEFPRYRKLFHPTPGSLIAVDGKDLVRALRRVSLLAADSWKCVRFDVSRDRLRLSTWSRDLGEAYEELDIDYNDKAFSVGYNVKYMIDLIGALGEDQELRLELYGGTFPGKFYGSSDPTAFAVLMPMRLEKEDEEQNEEEGADE